MPDQLLEKVKDVHQNHTACPIEDFDIRLKIRKNEDTNEKSLPGNNSFIFNHDIKSL